MRFLSPLLPVLVLAGCPDPEKQYPDATTTTPGADPAAGTAAPPPADAGGAAAAAAGGAPTVPSLTVEPGTGVKISGAYTYDGATKGAYRLDIFRMGSDGRPMILHAATLEKTGPWELEVPKDLGTVNIMAFVDSNGNGPELAEPSATLTDIAVGTEPVANLDLKPADGAKNDWAVDSPNLPAPGSAPPSAATTPPPDPAAATGGAAAPGAPGGTPPADAAVGSAPPADAAAAPAATGTPASP